MNRSRFEELVDKALGSMPREFQEMMENVAIFIEDVPSQEMLREAGVTRGHTLLGLYQGVPQTERTRSYNLVTPDRITLFQRPIEQSGRTDAEVSEQIRRTVLHEVGHYFGMDEERLDEIEAGWDAKRSKGSK